MRRLVLALCVAVTPLLLTSCEGPTGAMGAQGPTGARGPTGPQGPDGSVLTEFTGNLPSGNSSVDIGSFSSDDAVSAYIESSSVTGAWFEIGYPTGDNASTLHPWASIDYALGFVHFFNISTATRYKIIVVSSNSSSLSLSRSLDRIGY